MRNVIENVAVKIDASSSGCEIRCDGDGRLWCPSLSLSSSSESLSSGLLSSELISLVSSYESLSTAVYTLCPVPSSSYESLSTAVYTLCPIPSSEEISSLVSGVSEESSLVSGVSEESSLVSGVSEESSLVSGVSEESSEEEPPIPDICICGDPVGMVLIFQDEARSGFEAYSPTGTVVWDADVADWDDTVELFGAPEYAQLCQVWEAGANVAPTEATSVCKPLARDMPVGWTWDNIVRSPTEAQCKAVYDSAKGGAGVDDPTGLVLLGVDDSGSMHESTLGAGYSDFKDYLTSIGVEWKQVLFDHERWVLLAEENYTDTVASAEFDINFTGLENSSDCGICENLVGDFTLTDPILVTSAGGTFGSDGWSGDAYSRAADVPSGATHACIWKYEANNSCTWDYIESAPPGMPCDDVTKTLNWRGFLLVRFRISDTVFKWRIIVLYKLTLTCEDDGVGDEAYVDSGWYWEYGNNNPSCKLNGDEAWTSHFPDDTPLLEVYCNNTQEADFSDWCDDTLVLNSAETG